MKEKHKQILIEESQRKGKSFFENYCSPQGSKTWFQKTNRTRYYITTINRIKANHYSLAASMHRKNITESAACPCGAAEQDIDHTVFKCHQYNQRRRALIMQINETSKRLKSHPPTSMTQVLKSIS